MAWTFHCDACGMNITADSKQQLTDRVMRHANMAHNMHMSHEQAEETVEKKAQQEAA